MKDLLLWVLAWIVIFMICAVAVDVVYDALSNPSLAP